MIVPNLEHLEIHELIGLGGCARVYSAWDRDRGREVALKILNQLADEAVALRFRREGQSLVRLRHPHIVQVYEMGEQDGLWYISMELLRGGSLKERLQRGRLAWREAVPIAIQVAEALAHSHETRVVHRDVKPGNILFDEAGQVKLADFGLAHLQDAPTMTENGAVLGTVFYLSPEQAMGQPVDRRSDLYSLGAVLFEMLTGELPFKSSSPVGVIYKHLNERPARVCELESSIPRAVEAVVDRLLHKDPALRLQTAEECIIALREALASGGEGSTEDRWAAADAQAVTPEDWPPLFGRDAELRQLSQALEKATAGAGGMWVVAGEAGLGKSRLAHELVRRARTQGILALHGECLYSDAPNPYAPFVGILRALEAEHGVEADDRLRNAWRSARLVLQMDPLGREPEQLPWLSQASPSEGQTQAFEILTVFFQTLSRAQPLLLVLDDLHWASPATLQFLHYLARSIRGERILVLCLYRPEELLLGPDEGSHLLAETLRRMTREHLFEALTLSPLGAEPLAQITEAVLNPLALEPEFVELLRRECEGNPFYLLETLHLLQEQGALEQVGDHWELAAALAELEVPVSVADLVVRRTKRVTEEERELLGWAAVLGQRIDLDLLTALVGGTKLAVMKQLYGLQRGYGLLTSDEAGFQFAHGKVREILYEQLPEPLRREYHLAVGEALERHSAGKLETYVYDLARHFGRARQFVRSYQYAVMAAKRAEKAFALSEAVAYLAQALQALERLPDANAHRYELLRLKHRHARLLYTVGRQREACQAMEAALELGRSVGDRWIEAEILLDLAGAHGRVGDWATSLELGEQSRALASALQAPELEARALLSMGFFAFEQGDWDSAMQLQQRALSVAQQAGSALLEARILGNMGISHNARGEKQQAVELFARSVSTFAELQQPLDVVRGLNNEGYAYHGLGEYDRARRCYEEALEWLAKAGDVREQGLLYLHMAETELATGNLSQARESCVLATRRFARLGFELGIADVDRVYAGIAQSEGRWRVAERYLREAIAVYEEHEDHLNLAETHEELGRLLDEVGQTEGAREELERSKAMFGMLFGQVS